LSSGRPAAHLKYGTKLPPLLGIPSFHKLPHADLLDDAISLVQNNLSFSARTLGEERKRPAQIRARITLNRSAFNAVRAHRSTDPLAPRRCQQCPRTPPETAQHVLVSCPRYNVSREEMKKKLSSLIDRIRKARDHSSHWRRCINSEKKLLLHIILATPFALSQLNTADRTKLLTHTGDFLLDVHDIRPT